MSATSRHEIGFTPDWEWLEGRILRTSRPDTARRSGLWALSALKNFFGEDWIARFYASEGTLPGFLLDTPGHAVALTELLEWAARVEATATLAGIASVRRHARANLVQHRLTHTSVQLELAAVSSALGVEVRFEVQSASRSPVDVLMTSGPHRLPVEVFVVHVDEQMRLGFAEDRHLGERMMRIRFEHDVDFNGELRSPLSGIELDAWLDGLNQAAREVRAVRRAVRIEDEHSAVDVVPSMLASDIRFTGPPRKGRGWDRVEQRLLNKAKQAKSSGAEWLRVDLRDGIWQFSDWSSLPFNRRADAIASAVRRAIGDAGLHGVVISSGACQVQGDYIAQSTFGREHVGLARVLDSFRAREVIVIPLSEHGASTTRLWHAIYESEPDWLQTTLASHVHASLAEIVET